VRHRRDRTRYSAKTSSRTTIKAFNSDFDDNYVTVRIGSQSIDALIDTDAVRSLINKQTARDLKLHVVPKTSWNSKPLLSANGSELETNGHVMADLYLKGLNIVHHMEVVNSCHHHSFLEWTF